MIGETDVAGAGRPASGSPPARSPRTGVLPLARDYLALTKPRIIGLLLVTTVATMFVADPSGPGLATILLDGARRLPRRRAAPARSTTISSATATRAWTAPAAGPLVERADRSRTALVFGIVLGAVATFAARP